MLVCLLEFESLEFESLAYLLELGPLALLLEWELMMWALCLGLQ